MHITRCGYAHNPRRFPSLHRSTLRSTPPPFLSPRTHITPLPLPPLTLRRNWNKQSDVWLKKHEDHASTFKVEAQLKCLQQRLGERSQLLRRVLGLREKADSDGGEGKKVDGAGQRYEPMGGGGRRGRIDSGRWVVSN